VTGKIGEMGFDLGIGCPLISVAGFSIIRILHHPHLKTSTQTLTIIKGGTKSQCTIKAWTINKESETGREDISLQNETSRVRLKWKAVQIVQSSRIMIV
jgi:hypothetical protein